MLPGKNLGKLNSLKRHILHSPDRTQIIYTCTLLSFSQSLVIHDSRAEVQRFMIPKFLKQRFMILTCFVSMIHDAWFHSTPDTRVSLLPVPRARLVSLCAKFPRHLFWVMKIWQINNLPFKNMYQITSVFFFDPCFPMYGMKKVR